MSLANKAFASSIRSIDLQSRHRFSTQMLLYLPHYLPNLSQINSMSSSMLDDEPLDTAAKSHLVPTTFTFGSLALQINLDEETISDGRGLTALEEHLSRDVRLRHLRIESNRFETELLNQSFGEHKFAGLCELTIQLDAHPISLSWLPEFSRGHPLLKKISFADAITNAQPLAQDVFKCKPIIPFIEPFLRNEGLDGTTYIRGFAVSRAEPSSAWRVSGMHLYICGEWSSGRLLNVVHSSFPRISKLTIDTGDTTCPSDELVDPLPPCSRSIFWTLKTKKLALMSWKSL
ncbi:hypothetical protein BT96DRAFT_918197 [Gymnopus androsaceus JB14]|uniref:Uncharacterized protein n=1 Tax=Gymnopus androsaceus JB14 TaxID=1447944 RepID=A0A6A4HXR9_9AGAR|nr:hypothetical protein BT96DRAFT_918197 [Gymnopus androsaceus JB14]